MTLAYRSRSDARLVTGFDIATQVLDEIEASPSKVHPDRDARLVAALILSIGQLSEDLKAIREALEPRRPVVEYRSPE